MYSEFTGEFLYVSVSKVKIFEKCYKLISLEKITYCTLKWWKNYFIAIIILKIINENVVKNAAIWLNSEVIICGI